MGKLKLILEFTEFNALRLNPDSAQMSIHVDNPQLSINAFDKHEDSIRAGISKINDIINSISSTSAYRSLKSKLSLENQNIKSLKVLRIIKSNEVNYNVYISFVIDEDEYFGVVKNINSNSPQFRSEVFKDFDLIQSKEWRIKITGFIINSIKKWMNPKDGKYKVIKDYVISYNPNTGGIFKLEKNMEVDIIRSYENKIVVKWKNNYLNLVNDSYIYFNYWFEKIS